MLDEPLVPGSEPSVATERLAGHGVVVRVTGDLDLALAPSLERAIAREIARGRRRFAIDLSATTFLDCSSVGTLLSALAPLRDEPAAAVVLTGATGVVERLLTLLELDRVFEIVPDAGNAVGVTAGPARRRLDGWRRGALAECLALTAPERRSLW